MLDFKSVHCLTKLFKMNYLCLWEKSFPYPVLFVRYNISADPYFSPHQVTPWKKENFFLCRKFSSSMFRRDSITWTIRWTGDSSVHLLWKKDFFLNFCDEESSFFTFRLISPSLLLLNNKNEDICLSDKKLSLNSLPCWLFFFLGS